MAFLGRLVMWAQNHSRAPGPALWTAFPGPPVSWLLSQCGQCWEDPGVSPLVGTAGPDPPFFCLATQARLRETLVVCSSAVSISLCSRPSASVLR